MQTMLMVSTDGFALTATQNCQRFTDSGESLEQFDRLQQQLGIVCVVNLTVFVHTNEVAVADFRTTTIVTAIESWLARGRWSLKVLQNKETIEAKDKY